MTGEVGKAVQVTSTKTSSNSCNSLWLIDKQIS